MLGTGNALTTRCYNTCFALHSAAGCALLVDAGGGNGILSQLERAGLRKEEIHDLFVTHAHTDHLLGAIWIVRMALQFKYSLNVWSHAKVLSLLDGICRQILPQKEVSRLGDLVTFRRLEDGGTFRVGDMRFQCFDIHSSKEPQFGFTATFAHGLRPCCLGDEPFNPLCREYAQDADWLMHEAFCTYADRERDPTRKATAPLVMQGGTRRSFGQETSFCITPKTAHWKHAPSGMRMKRERRSQATSSFPTTSRPSCLIDIRCRFRVLPLRGLEAEEASG